MSSTLLSPDYEPSADEEFMNERMLAFFRVRLRDWRADLLRETGQTLQQRQWARVKRGLLPPVRAPRRLPLLKGC